MRWAIKFRSVGDEEGAEEGSVVDKWFVFLKELGLPVYIRCNVDEFLPEFVPFLASLHFTELPKEEVGGARRLIELGGGAKVLEMRPANAVVTKQINSTVPNDVYGSESIVPRDGYKVYRYKKTAIVLYSFGTGEWAAGCFRDFGSGENRTAYRCVINRYLSWALAPMGIVGFWGRKSQAGIEVLKQGESLAEVVFVDIQNGRLVASDGIETIRSDCRIVRYDAATGGSQMKMDKIQLTSFLIQYTSYFDYAGPSVPVRQAVREIAWRLEGVVCAKSVSETNPRLSL